MEFKSFVFYGESYLEPEEIVPLRPPMLPDGTYFLLDGELRRLVDEMPPGAVPLTAKSGLFNLGKGDSHADA